LSNQYLFLAWWCSHLHLILPFHSQEAAKAELPASGMKLIHSGKVLKDDDTIEACNIKPNDFLVVMVSKPKKAAPPAPAAAAPSPAAPGTPAPAASTTAAAEETPAPAAPAAAAQPPPAPARPADDFSAETVANLTVLGFPEAEVRHCLRAANGNPDIAVEFLTNGIPPGIPQPGSTTETPAANRSTGQPLQALRNHPQFNDLRRLVQSNPQMLPQVLTQIGQQQPELLQEINANQAQFLQMMNEPVSETLSSPAAPAGGTRSAPSAASMMEGMGNPAQMAQMLQNMSPEELQQMATMMGLTPEQLQATARMIGQIPPEQLQEYMMQAMQAGGGGMAGGPQVLRLNEEEMAAVDRLTEMGFDRTEAAQAFLACDKNEALAANLLMDSAGQEGGAFGFPSDDDNGGGNDDDDGDDMYD
jgi:UV excision repair protein RAD23